MKYFIVGFMASGKSRKAKIMSRALSLRWIDLDDYIERREYRTISEIFRVEGEDCFRKMEMEYLREVCELYDNFVLSAGGGTPCYYDNMKFMNEQGKTIFMNTDIDVIIKRLQRSKYKRPLVSKLSGEDLKLYVKDKLEERMPYYSQAQEVLYESDEF